MAARKRRVWVKRTPVAVMVLSDGTIMTSGYPPNPQSSPMPKQERLIQLSVCAKNRSTRSWNKAVVVDADEDKGRETDLKLMYAALSEISQSKSGQLTGSKLRAIANQALGKVNIYRENKRAKA